MNMLTPDQLLELEMANARGGNDWLEALEEHGNALLSEAQLATTIRRDLADARHHIADWKHVSGCQTPEDLRQRIAAIDSKMAGTNEKLAELEKMIAAYSPAAPGRG